MPLSFSLLPNSSPTDHHRRIAGEDRRQGGEKDATDVLPPELWTEILVRLPVRTLLTLKCVAKYFLSLIQNPNFISLHLPRYNSESNVSDLLLIELRGSLTSCRGNLLTKKSEFVISIDDGHEVVDYVNGLLWLQRSSSSIKYMLLCNPSIRKCLLIPPSPASHLGKADVGFGYDPISDNYKAVVIAHVGGEFFDFRFSNRSLVEVYSLNTGSWRRIEVNLVPGEWYLGRSVYANGAVHWIANPHNGQYFNPSDIPNGSHVISFDLGTEVFSYRELPNADDHGCSGLKLPLSLHRSLAVLDISSHCIHIWVMKENGWTKEYMTESSFLYSYVSSGNSLAANRITNAMFCEESGELLIAGCRQGVISYNFRTRKFKISHYSASYVARYVESLLWNDLLPPASAVYEAHSRNQ